jgi:hypothetical protein
VSKCSECNRSAHRECAPLVPHFCGLAPETAKVLVAAFEEHEKKMFLVRLEEAEKDENARRVEGAAVGGGAVGMNADLFVEPNVPLPASPGNFTFFL